MYVVHLNIASGKKKCIIYFVDNILGAPFGYGLHVVPILSIATCQFVCKNGLVLYSLWLSMVSYGVLITL